MATSKIDRSSKENKDTGFGVLPNQLGERFVRKDGSFNMIKEGMAYWERISLYSTILKLSWRNFFLLILVFYILVNGFFTFVYWLIGFDQLTGINETKGMSKLLEVFFFCIQTFTTVGYGRINPVGILADITASFQAMLGWLFFALVTGLLYGRFTRPQAFLAFSENALISPFKEIQGLMFRMVPFKINHHLTDAHVIVTLAMLENTEGSKEYKFYNLKLERSKIDTFNMNWTVVHPIDEESPLLNYTHEELRLSDAEIYVQVTGFDPIFSNTVMQRSSYTAAEIIWNAKFVPMYRESADGSTTIIELDKLNVHTPVMTAAK
jgi:inward rectifier potassium channel